MGLRVRRRVAVLLVAAAVPGFMVLRAGPARATVDCMEYNTYYSRFDGYVSTDPDPFGQKYEGASAAMINNSAPVCDTGTHDPLQNFNYVFTMIHQNNSAPGGGGSGYAQMGFYRGWNQCMYFTAEWSRDSSDSYHRHIHPEYGCLTSGSANHYWVQYFPFDPVSGHSDFRMNVDVTIMDWTPWDPYALSNWLYYGPWWTEFLAETKYLGSNVPTSSFGGMQVQMSNNSWTSQLPNMYDGCPWPVRYAKTGISSQYFALQTYGSSSAYNC